MGEIGYLLVAEDNVNDLELMQMALKQYNLANSLVAVEDGAEALDYLQRRGKYGSRTSGNPLAILLDIKMPRVNGIEVLKAIKESPELREIPVVMLTSSREGPDIRECYRLGANAYVVKPVDFPQFAEAIKTIGRFWAILNQPPEPVIAAV